MSNVSIRRRLFALLLLIVFYSIANGQEENLIPAKKLMKDFEKFEEFIETHPDPYANVSKGLFNTKMESIKSSLNDPHSHLDFYKKLASVVALINDGHSKIWFSRFWMEKKRKEFGCFPYEMHLTNANELYVLKNFGDGAMNPGVKVVEINGFSVDSFLGLIDPYISYEKLNFRNTIIDDDFEKYLYIAFDVLDDLTFKYVKRDTHETAIKMMSFKEWKKFQKNDREKRDVQISRGEPYAYSKIDHGIGMLSIYGFYASDFKAYNLFLLKTFKAMRKDSIHSLIIDIRGNYGGWPKIASELFHYISEGHFKTMAKSSMKVSYPYRNYFFERYPVLRSNNAAIPKRRHYVDVGGIMSGEINSFVDETKFFNEKPVTENNEFYGDVYLLTNRDSYSAASSFASTFQCYGMGIIIGEETGGTKIFRANPIGLKLPHSGLGVQLSTTKLYTSCYNEELEGVMPNLTYSPSVLDLLSDIDTQLLYAQRVIKKIEKRKLDD